MTDWAREFGDAADEYNTIREERTAARGVYDALNASLRDPLRDYRVPDDFYGYTPDPLVEVNPLRGKLLGLDALRLVPPPEALNDVLYYDSLAWLAGPPGSYKSFLAVQWAAEAAVKGVRVLYVAAEGVAGMARRFDAWCATARQRIGSELMFLPEAVDISSQWHWLEEVVCDGKPRLIVLDTQARMTPGLEENSSAEMGKYVAAADRLRRASGACVLTLHHSAKGGAHLRGSTALQGAADTVVAMVRADEMQPVVEMRNVKQKDSEQVAPRWLRRVEAANGSMTLMEQERPDWWPKA